MKKFFLILILVIGFYFRFVGVNWDQNQHLHPDERFLTMVGNAMKLPKTFSAYLDPKISTFNPGNTGYNFFVYGTFPVVLNKLLAIANKTDDYNLFTIQGRMLSAFFDLLIVILVFKATKLLLMSSRPSERSERNDTIPLWSAFFYAIAVYPIQASHFFTVDTFLNFFMFGSFYFGLRFWPSQNDVILASGRSTRVQNLIFSAIFFGLALACKISAVYILPLVLFFVILNSFQDPDKRFRNKFGMTFFYFFIFLFVSYLSLRFADPYYFQSANFFDPRPNPSFVNSIKSLTQFIRPDVWYPPAVQWIGKPATFLLTNLAFFGVGIPYFIFMIIGIIWIISNFKFQNSKKLIIILFWVLAYFVYQSFQFVKSIRYTIYLYPFFAIFAGIGFSRVKSSIVKSFFLTLVLLWPLTFSTIYFYKHTRVEASEWLYRNLPSNSVILGESWDDPLPLFSNQTYGKNFTIEQLPVFDPDTPQKWQKMNEMLLTADYYVLSSNRGWGSIATVPEKYPKMSKFYNDLLSGKNPQYKKIKEFSPYYYHFFKLPSSWVEETFTVYDHPQVIIYKNVKKL